MLKRNTYIRKKYMYSNEPPFRFSLFMYKVENVRILLPLVCIYRVWVHSGTLSTCSVMETKKLTCRSCNTGTTINNEQLCTRAVLNIKEF